MATRFLLFTLLCLIGSLQAQSIVVHPYLQDAEPDRIKILWEASGASTGSVAWGTSQSNLDQTATTTSEATGGGDILFTAAITGLQPATRYYYQVITGSVADHVHHFITPPLPSSEASFNLVAMSDMQKDGSHPNKYHEVVHDGILDYFTAQFGEDDIANNLGFVMIPGDLVPNGNSHNQWQNDFFGPSDPLFSHVPVYPVLGNHENNSNFYFQYFALPENGSAGFMEHWWYKDYSNVRIVGLNSNGGYRIQEQLDWLEGVLDEACQEEHIDFVFAQLHHPHLSELWTPGELDYTGDVISLLETFSTDCGKPSIHFFGHTHGYSRGQSRDHNHLWVNAASAGGAIDNWGEFPNQDYEEFSKSIDEYGFVVLNVEAGNTPQFVLKRITRGDQDVVIDNEEQDIITIRRNEAPPQQPVGLFPVGSEVQPGCFVIQANAFNDNNDFHQASHWQVASDCNDFSNPVIDSWKQHENLYDEVDTQADDDLTNEEAGGLEENQTYCWRVRYRDEHLEWSEWSVPVTFSTTTGGSAENQLKNGGAENGVDSWSIETGSMEALTAGECNGISPRSGSQYFAVGGLCDGNETAFSEVSQDISVVGFAGDIDAGVARVNFGGYLANFSGSDRPEMMVDYLDGSTNLLGTSAVLSSTSSQWTLVDASEVIPGGTRVLRVRLTGTRNAGTDNDSYFDDLFTRVSIGEEVACSELSSLPAELLSFTVRCERRYVDVAWEIAAASEIKAYVVERSADGTRWERVGEVIPDEAAAERQRYTYRDFDRSGSASSLYRLHILELDDTGVYSDVVADDCRERKPLVSLFPSPLEEGPLFMKVYTMAPGMATLRVSNLLGQEVHKSKQQLVAETNHLSIAATNWQPGYYHVVLRTESWEWSGKLVVK